MPQDDGLHDFLSVKFPIFNPQGALHALCGISTDITQRKRAEEHLQAKNRDLELALIELTETQSQLHQAQRLKAIGTLAAGVAHEVKNPLQILLFGLIDLEASLRTNDPEVEQGFANARAHFDHVADIYRAMAGALPN